MYKEKIKKINTDINQANQGIQQLQGMLNSAVVTRTRLEGRLEQLKDLQKEWEEEQKKAPQETDSEG